MKGKKSLACTAVLNLYMYHICLSLRSPFNNMISLHWFKSIQSKYAADEDDLTEKKNSYEAIRNAKIAASKQTSWFSSSSSSTVEDNNQDDDEEMTILTLMGKRLDGNRREMAMLFFSMSGALSFFKDRGK